MLFNSLHFALFFPIVTLGFFILPQRLRWIWLLGWSCYFYMVFVPYYILILLGTIAVDYTAGLAIGRSEGRTRKWFLIASIIANVGVLAVFKYFNFVNENLAGLSSLFGYDYSAARLSLVLPIGLSFHTFQSMSYTIEVYRGRQKPERHLGIFALYVMFYPQLVAGPIERPQNLLHQFREKQYFDYQRVVDGLQLMAWGLFKKVVIADRLALYVNENYGSPARHEGIPLILATWAFAIQIFCDFSGYSDIAIGAAQVMGFKLMTNFRQPYLAQSVAEFWKRWHISLSTWFRDYVYIPLGGNRVGRYRLWFNIMVVFLVSGLWHGASWNYVIWGGLNGVCVIGEGWILKFIPGNSSESNGLAAKCGRILRIFLTFNLICLTWIFFRARNLTDAWYIVTHLAPVGATLKLLDAFRPVLSYQILFLAGLMLIVVVTHFLQERYRLRNVIHEQPAAVRWLAYSMSVAALLLCAQFGTGQQFIYFQF